MTNLIYNGNDIITSLSTPNVWGTEDGDTSDVFGDNWGADDRVIYPIFSSVPLITDKIHIDFKARITESRTYSFDLFGAYVSVNGKGGYYQPLMTWDPVTINGSSFVWYRLILPTDINGDGVVDWIAGTNELHIWTWSKYNDKPAKTGVDIIKVSINGEEPEEPEEPEKPNILTYILPIGLGLGLLLMLKNKKKE